MATVIGAFKATLGIDVSEYTSGILSANATTEIFGQTFTNFLANPVLGGIGLLKHLGASLIQAAGDNLEYAETIQRVAQETGASTDAIQTLREVLDDAGVSADQAQVGLAKFADMLGTARRDGGPAADAIRDLGLNLEQVGDGEPAIRAVLEALADIESASARADLAAALFGRTAGPVLANAVRQGGGSLKALTEEYTKFGLVLGGDLLEASSKLDSTMDALGNTFEGMQRTLTAEFLAGFQGEVESAGNGVQQLTALTKELAPVARDAGAEFGSLAAYLTEVVGGFKALLPILKEINEWREAWANGLAKEWTAGKGIGGAIVRASVGDYMSAEELARPGRPGDAGPGINRRPQR